jgi:membrane-associated phospholipid phosphatase
MVGWGGLVGLILSLSLRFNTDLVLFLILAILFSGIVGFARLKLTAHSPMQVYMGFLIGFLIMITVFVI